MTAKSPAHRQRGLSMVEAVVSIAIVGVMAVAAFAAVGATRTMEYRIAERECGLLLAEDLMAEIMRQEYADPDGGATSFGPRAAELATGDRSRFNDVDDYHGWTSSPPQQQDGAELPDLAGWRRTVEVAWVSPSQPNKEVPANSNLKRIIVRVLHRDREVMSLTALRSTTTRDAVEQLSIFEVANVTVSQLHARVSGD